MGGYSIADEQLVWFYFSTAGAKILYTETLNWNKETIRSLQAALNAAVLSPIIPPLMFKI